MEPTDIPRLLEARLPGPRLERLRQVQAAAARLELPAYLVGGFVRDLLLGLVPGDFDVVVEPGAPANGGAPGPRLARALAAEIGGEVSVHAAFGTATWFDPEGRPIDFATTRTETYPAPGALPEVTPAVSIKEDLGRRDFSINAIAIRIDGAGYGELLDPYHGLADLAARLVRVLHPRSFVDDPTRLFRAVRYASRLDFDLAGDTLVLMPSALIVVEALSGERLRHEFDLIFREPRAPSMLARLEALGILRAAHQALRWTPAEARRAAVLESWPPAEWRLDPVLARQAAYLALLLAGAAPDRAGPALDRLAVRREVYEAVTGALALKVGGWVEPPRPSEIVAQLDRLNPAAVAAAAVLNEAARSVLHDYLAAWRFVRPELNGDDLQALGLAPGPEFKRLLWELRAARLDGAVGEREGEVALVRQWTEE